MSENNVDYNDTYLTIEEASKLFRMNSQTLYRKIKKKEIPSIKLGGKILIPKKAAIDHAHGNKNKSNERDM